MGTVAAVNVIPKPAEDVIHYRFGDSGLWIQRVGVLLRSRKAGLASLMAAFRNSTARPTVSETAVSSVSSFSPFWRLRISSIFFKASPGLESALTRVIASGAWPWRKG